MKLENIIENKKFILLAKSKAGDDRLYYEDEDECILYIFGPAKNMKLGYSDEKSDIICAIEFENGPHVSVGDEVLKNKFAKSLKIEYPNDIPLVTINYDIKISDSIFDGEDK